MRLPLTVYKATPTSVTLVTTAKLKSSQPLLLQIAEANLIDAFGRHLNGGQSVTFTFGNKTIKAAPDRPHFRYRD
jgi:hypothetical protein